VGLYKPLYILRTNYNAKNADFKFLPLLSVSKCSQFSSVNQVNGRLLKRNLREKTMIFDEDYFKKNPQYAIYLSALRRM
jgi:hypothetical protein